MRNQNAFGRVENSREDAGFHCSVDWHSPERIVCFEVERYRSHGGNDVRGPFHRSRICGTLQNRVITKTCSSPPLGLRCSREGEIAIVISQTGRLGLCQPPHRWKVVVLGTIDSAQVSKAGGPGAWNRETFWVAHVSSHVLDPIEERRHGVQVMQELLRHSTIRSTLDVYTQAVTSAKQSAQAAVMALVFSSQ